MARENNAYNSIDPKGRWFESKAQFPLEDPTNAGKGTLPRFEPLGFTQATKTPWLAGQCAQRVFVEYTSDPRTGGEPIELDDKGQPLKPGKSKKEDDGKAAEAEAKAKAAADAEAAAKAAADAEAAAKAAADAEAAAKLAAGGNANGNGGQRR